MEFYKWEGDEEKLLRDVRDSFNMLAKVNVTFLHHGFVSMLQKHHSLYQLHLYCSIGLEMTRISP